MLLDFNDFAGQEGAFSAQWKTDNLETTAWSSKLNKIASEYL
jgi:hypothetical protein